VDRVAKKHSPPRSKPLDRETFSLSVKLALPKGLPLGGPFYKIYGFQVFLAYVARTRRDE